MDSFNNMNRNILERIFLKITINEENIIKDIYDEVIKLTEDVDDIKEVNKNIDIVVDKLIKRRKKIDKIIWNTLWQK